MFFPFTLFAWIGNTSLFKCPKIHLLGNIEETCLFLMQSANNDSKVERTTFKGPVYFKNDTNIENNSTCSKDILIADHDYQLLRDQIKSKYFSSGVHVLERCTHLPFIS